MTTEKRRASALVLALLIFGLSLFHLFLPDGALSTAERRRLQQLPALTWAGLRDGSFADDLETYLLDQFPLRSQFLALQGFFRLKLLGQSDLNGVYVDGNSAAELLSALDAEQVDYFCRKVHTVLALMTEQQKAYYAVIPDKGYYMAREQDLPVLDYDALMTQVRAGLDGLTEIDLFSLLSLEDYYATDPHWKQASILPVADALLAAMDAGSAGTDWTAHDLSPFYGAYCGRSLGLRPETLTYLTNAVTDGAVVHSAELQGDLPVYPTEKLSGIDGYDVFLHGAQAFVTLENPAAETDRELVIFRDSFGSSIAPLLLGSYARVTLVDLRYLDMRALPSLLTMEDQDVLFLYNTSLVNAAKILR